MSTGIRIQKKGAIPQVFWGPGVFAILHHVDPRNCIPYMTKRSWKSRLAAAGFFVVILCVLNPELRALLLFADALGLDVVLLLVATQLRVFWPTFRIAADPIVRFLCMSSSLFARTAMRVLPVLPVRPFGAMLCPLLVGLSYGVRCRIQAPASRAP